MKNYAREVLLDCCIIGALLAGLAVAIDQKSGFFAWLFGLLAFGAALFSVIIRPMVRERERSAKKE